MRQATGRMWAVVGLALFLAAGGPARTGDQGALPADLKLVSGKGGGFVSVRVADLLKSARGKELLQKLAKMEPKVDIDKEMTRELGVGPTQMERVTVLLGEATETEPVVVFRTTRAIDRDKMFAGLRFRPVEKQHQGRTYYAPSYKGRKIGTAYYFVSDRVFVSSNERSLMAWLENDPAKADPGAYRPALLQAAKGSPAVVAVGLPLLTQMTQPLPKELSDLLQPKSALLTVVCDKDTQADLRMTFADAKAAKDAAGALKGAIGLSREQIPLLRGELGRAGNEGIPLPEPMQMALGQADLILRQADKALADAQVSAEGTAVHARARSQTEAGQLVIAGAMLGRVGASAEAKMVAPAPAPPKKEEKKK